MSASTELRSPRTFAPLLHVVTLECKDAEHADRCLTALREHGRPDALAYGCVSYEFGPRVDSPSTIQIVVLLTPMNNTTTAAANTTRRPNS